MNMSKNKAMLAKIVSMMSNTPVLVMIVKHLGRESPMPLSREPATLGTPGYRTREENLTEGQNVTTRSEWDPVKVDHLGEYIRMTIRQRRGNHPDGQLTRTDSEML